MSSKSKKIESKIKEEYFKAYSAIAATPYGSFIMSANIFLPKDLQLTEEEIVSRFKTAKLPFLEDKDFLKKTSDAIFGPDVYDDYIVGLPLAVVEDRFTSLICPYADGKVWPFRKDGFIYRAMFNAEPKVINWDAEERW